MTFLSELYLRRNLVAILTFFGSASLYILRANLSIAVVAMTEKYEKIAENRSIKYVQDFTWNSKEKGHILGSFFYGYVSTQLIGGWLGGKIGGARLYGFGILATAILNLSIPFTARLGIDFLIMVRVIEGIFEGVTFPCLFVIWSKWAPAQERTQLITISFAGVHAGTVTAFPACGFVMHKLGWPSVFYITSAVIFLWCFIWFAFIRDDPANDPWILESELKYIKGPLKESSKIEYPWKSIFTSGPFWITVFAQSCDSWGFSTLLTELPSFANDISHINIQSIGFLSAIPYLVMCFTVPLSGFIADRMRRKDFFTTTQVRKILNTIAFIGQAVFTTSAVFMESVYTTITCLTLSLGIGAFSCGGALVNHLDIAPQYSGVLMGIANTIGSIPGFVSPILTGYIVQNKTKEEWRIVFYISSAVFLIGAVIYAIFGSAERQSWAIKNEDDKIGGSMDLAAGTVKDCSSKIEILKNEIKLEG